MLLEAVHVPRGRHLLESFSASGLVYFGDLQKVAS